MLANQFVLQKLCWFWREFDWWLHLIENLGIIESNYFQFFTILIAILNIIDQIICDIWMIT